MSNSEYVLVQRQILTLLHRLQGAVYVEDWSTAVPLTHELELLTSHANRLWETHTDERWSAVQ